MSNTIDSKMSADKQELAKKIIYELKLDTISVKYDEKTQNFEFAQDRRVVSVPLSLAQGEVGESLRFLFRAILASPNSKWNHAADDNDWGGKNHYK